MKKTFLLGAGAQKSGTTWLHGFLSENKSVDFGRLKEYHIWDALYIKECSKFIAPKEDALRHSLQNTAGAYEKYFSSLIRGDVRLTGDITPSYSGLPTSALHLIRDRIESAGFNIKIVFLMRDPFERCWSAVRMDRRNGREASPEIERLRNAYKSPDFIFRTNYKNTIQALESAFVPHQIYYGIYEELFKPEKIKELSDFLEVSYRPDLASKKFNTSPKIDNEALVLAKEIREFYSDVYTFCRERFPQTESLWGLHEN